jgi:hypothetical protein
MISSLQCAPEKSEIFPADGHSPYHRQEKYFLACKQSENIFSVYGTAHCLRSLYHELILFALLS